MAVFSAFGTGNVSIVNSTIRDNSTAGTDSLGGGVYAELGSISITSSTVANNSTLGTASDGGGIASPSGSITITNSTISGNRTEGDSSDGGGVFSFAGDLLVENSTISGNSTNGPNAAEGGGLYANNGAVSLLNSTITANETMGTSGEGGGVFVGENLGSDQSTLTVLNTIIAGNAVAAGDSNPDLFIDDDSPFAIDYSLIGDISGLSVTDLTAILTGSGNLTNVDAELGPLSNNGGPDTYAQARSGQPGDQRRRPGLQRSAPI